jgi:hypothetical protein
MLNSLLTDLAKGLINDQKEFQKMHVAELRNQALVAATAAKESGFTSTYDALIEIVRELSLGDPRSAQTPALTTMSKRHNQNPLTPS